MIWIVRSLTCILPPAIWFPLVHEYLRLIWQVKVRHVTYNHVYLFEVIWELRVERHDEVGSGKICLGLRCCLRRGTRAGILIWAGQHYIDASNAESLLTKSGGVIPSFSSLPKFASYSCLVEKAWGLRPQYQLNSVDCRTPITAKNTRWARVTPPLTPLFTWATARPQHRAWSPHETCRTVV